VKVAAE